MDLNSLHLIRHVVACSYRQHPLVAMDFVVSHFDAIRHLPGLAVQPLAPLSSSLGCSGAGFDFIRTLFEVVHANK